MTNELYHHGIKGQRWGVRRFQNADGTLTASGRKRYGTEYEHNLQIAKDKRSLIYAKASAESDASKAIKMKRADHDYEYDVKKTKNELTSKIKEDVSKRNENKITIAKEASKITKELANANETSARRRKQRDMELLDTSKLSDEEMRARINHIQLERQYRQLMTEDRTRGELTVNNMLAVGGTILATTASVLSIANQVRQLMDK